MQYEDVYLLRQDARRATARDLLWAGWALARFPWFAWKNRPSKKDQTAATDRFETRLDLGRWRIAVRHSPAMDGGRRYHEIAFGCGPRFRHAPLKGPTP